MATKKKVVKKKVRKSKALVVVENEVVELKN